MFLLAAFALLAAPALAPLDALPQGTVGVSFGFPLGGSPDFVQSPPTQFIPTIGVTYFVAPRVSARVDLGLNAVLAPSGPATQTSFTLSTALRFYGAHRRDLWAFVQPLFGIGRQGNGGSMFLDGGLGVGAEYFFADRFSIAGIVGLTLMVSNIGGPAGSSAGVTLSTRTSGLFASLYF